MQVLSQPRQKILDTARSYWRRADSHPSMVKWRTDAIENGGFYDGTGQWSPDQVQTVINRKQQPLTVNIISPRIDSLSGVEIQSRFRTAVKSSSGELEHERLANSLTHLLYYFQQNQRIPYKGSLKFRDMLIYGIGWSNLYQQDGFNYEHVHPFNIMPDFDDLSPQFENMKFVCRKRWMEPDVIKRTWPKVSQYIDFSDTDLFGTVYSPELNDRETINTIDNGPTGYTQSRTLVCEVQYKQPKKAYCGMDSNGFYFETFDEEKAEEMANSPKDIEEKQSVQIMRILFLGDYLLEASPLNPNVPNLQDFTYIPCVWKREFKTGVPYGLVSGMKDIQRSSNTCLTKALFLANSSKLIITGHLPEGQTPYQIGQDLKRPDSVIVLPPDTKYELRDNTPLASAQFDIIDRHDKEIQLVTGMHDDLMGKETNASSGVAQRQRQLSSVRNNVFAFDSFADMKNREAKFMLDLIQGGDNENLLSQILTEDEKEIIILNLTRTIKGKKVVFNDIRTLPISLEIEEVPDFKNSMEENKASLENLLSNPNATLIMQSPSLMRRLGIRDYEKLSEEMSENMAKQQAAQNPQSKSQPEAPQEPNLAYAGM